MNHLQSKWLTLLVSLGILTGCSSSPTDSNPETQVSASETITEPLYITVSILPQEYFVEKIGGDRVEVNVMVEPGASPATYEPKPQQMKALSEAEAYVNIGVPFEKAWMEKIKGANPQMLVIDSAQGIEQIEMVAHHHHGEEHGGEAEHAHDHGAENLDPHVWLSPQLVKVQAENIYQGLVEIDPENEAEYQANLAQFLTEIDQLDQQIQQNLAGIENRQFIVFHPAWGYFARSYDLEQISIEVGGQEPSAAELGEIVKEAQEENIKVIFAQPEFSTKSAETIAQEIGGKVSLITPLAPDWSNNLLQVSQTFAEVLQKEGDTN
ncbi:MAG: zinc ABC transporter substrate-binding protein [Cyanobacteria bacterium P01_G01_bin.39]